MSTVVILPRANAEIIDVLDFTREQFGEAKYLEYRELFNLALTTLEATPTAGKRRPEITLTAGRTTSVAQVEKRDICSSTASERSQRSPGSSTTRRICHASGPGNGNDERHRAR